jgi:antitoxin ParD1/3/4
MNISMPESLAKEVTQAVKEGNFASKSEFIRDLLREWKMKKLLADIAQSRKESAQGKDKVLRSLKDLR